MNRLAISAIVLFLSTAGTALAAPVYWTPSHMVAALTALQYPHPGILNGSCTGLLTPRHRAYSAFRCRITWQIIGTNGNPTQTGTVRAFAKPAPAGRVCGSTVSLSSCRLLAAGPLAGDPTVCTATRPDPVQKAHDCAQAAAKAAIVAKLGVQVNLVCEQAATVYVWNCTRTAGPATVTFTRGVSAWTATVTP